MDIQPAVFSAKKILAWRETVPIAEISKEAIYGRAYAKIAAFIRDQKIKVVGPRLSLYFTWDEKNQTTDVALGLPIKNTGSVEGSGLQLIELKESKALMAVHRGDYVGLKAVHDAFAAYFRQHPNLAPGLAIEEYLSDPLNADPKKVVTNVYYLLR